MTREVTDENLGPVASGSLAAGTTLFLAGYALHKIIPIVAPSITPQLDNTALYRPWLGWTHIYMAAHPFFYGSVFAAIFLWLRRCTAFPPRMRGGLLYGAGVFVVGSLPVYVLNFASLQISPEMILFWILASLIQYALAGMVLGCVCDGASLRVSAVLPVPASRVWDLLLLKTTFLFITRGMMSYADTEQWPTTLFREDTEFTTQVRFFGFGPSSPHRARVVRVDRTRGEIETDEDGGLVSFWNHQMRVESVSDVECRYTDSVELQAGLMTPLAWLFATLFYRYRQRRWRKLLKTNEPAADME